MRQHLSSVQDAALCRLGKTVYPIKQPIRQTSGNRSDNHVTFTVIHAGDDDT